MHRRRRGRCRPSLPGLLGSPVLVPREIPRPPYAAHRRSRAAAEPNLVRTPDEIERMRVAGASAAEISSRSARPSQPGVTTDELDAIGHEATHRPRRLPEPAQLPRLPQVGVHLRQRGHLPRHPRQPPARRRRHRQRRRHRLSSTASTATPTATFAGGRRRRASAMLIRDTRAALHAGIATCAPGCADQRDRPGHREPRAQARTYGVVREFIGHGIGDRVPRRLQIPHYYDSRRRTDPRGGHDLHDRADDHPRRARALRVGRRLDRGHPRRPALARSSSTVGGHRRRRRDRSRVVLRRGR